MKYEYIGTTYDGVKIIKPILPSKRFTEKEIREIIQNHLTNAIK